MVYPRYFRPQVDIGTDFLYIRVDGPDHVVVVRPDGSIGPAAHHHSEAAVIESGFREVPAEVAEQTIKATGTLQ